MLKLRLITAENKISFEEGRIPLNALPIVFGGKWETCLLWAESKGFTFRQGPVYHGKTILTFPGFLFRRTKKGKIVSLIVC